MSEISYMTVFGDGSHGIPITTVHVQGLKVQRFDYTPMRINLVCMQVQIIKL